jgi:quinol monooxygenase YgiN
MAVKVIFEMKAKPGQRDELLNLIEQIMTEHGQNMTGSLGATFYEAVDNPDMLVEIADWESAEAREAVLKELEATGALAPMFDLLGGPPRTTLVELPH